MGIELELLDKELDTCIDEYFDELKRQAKERCTTVGRKYKGKWRSLTAGELEEMRHEELLDLIVYSAMLCRWPGAL